MAHKQPMAQVILENSNKKNITVDLKNKLKQENGKKYVENVINVLFQYPSNIPEKEVIDWCDVLIAGGNNFEEFSQTGLKFKLVSDSIYKVADFTYNIYIYFQNNYFSKI